MVMFIGCGHKSEAWDTMDTAEVLMDSMPDSALTVLSSIEKTSLGDDKEKARYALLMSMALDKNYIDTTSFDVSRQSTIILRKVPPRNDCVPFTTKAVYF